MSEGNGLERLRGVVKRLRAPDGCPWDRVQTLHTLKSCLLEECYELLQAMDSDCLEDHREELGDVLLQVVFQCDIRESEGRFTLDDVANAVCDKLIRRHPHVFGGVKTDDVAQVLKNWENIKKGEKHGPPGRSALDGVPPALPALLKAQRTQAKAARVGFDWRDSSGAFAKVEEEFAELKEAVASGNRAAIEDEMGDVFFSLVNTCRFLKVDAEDAVSVATAKFAKRFRAVEKEAAARGLDMKACTIEELDALWNEVKRRQREGE